MRKVIAAEVGSEPTALKAQAAQCRNPLVVQQLAFSDPAPRRPDSHQAAGVRSKPYIC